MRRIGSTRTVVVDAVVRAVGQVRPGGPNLDHVCSLGEPRSPLRTTTRLVA